jgi:LuxR family maltose regulon positive regulatory protein
MSAPATHHRVEILVLEVLLRQAEGNKEQAMEKLVEAVTLAQPTGCTQPFIRFADALTELLEPLKETDSHGDFVRQIMASCHHADSACRTEQPTKNPLTYREQETLELLAQRYHNDEIARELGVSVETVKTHLSALYKKLNVHGRRDAVSAGEALGLLVPQTGLSHLRDRRSTMCTAEGESP